MISIVPPCFITRRISYKHLDKIWAVRPEDPEYLTSKTSAHYNGDDLAKTEGLSTRCTYAVFRDA